MEFVTLPGRVIVHLRPNLARPSYEMFLREQTLCCVCVVCTVSPDGYGYVFPVLWRMDCAGSRRAAHLNLEQRALLLDT